MVMQKINFEVKELMKKLIEEDLICISKRIKKEEFDTLDVYFIDWTKINEYHNDIRKDLFYDIGYKLKENEDIKLDIYAADDYVYIKVEFID